MMHLRVRVSISKKVGKLFSPSHFFSVRWVENERVAGRALQVLPNFKKAIEYYKSLAPSKQPQNNISYETLVQNCNEKLLTVRIHFFQDISRILNDQFLVLFQTDKPMIPFLCDSLQRIVRQLMLIFGLSTNWSLRP